MLKIDNLHASIEDKEILKGLSLDIKPGEIHAIMGPNGAGKSTLSQVLTGREAYTVTSGSIEFEGRDLLELSVEERARAGIFLAFQYPIEIPGVSNAYFMRAAVNAMRRERGLPELDAMDFVKKAKAEMKLVGMRDEFLYRSVNEGFSGGEKKRNEVLQMALLEPKLAILDETDSGLDIDALKTVADGVNRLRSPDRSMIVITHYQRLLDYIVPDYVHVLAQGRIVRSGGRELALELEEKGYGWIEGAAPAAKPAARGAAA
ncbi:Fe-S cluster assembly ATPase SufC [Castellaniella ginsengisoli]|uniref:Fe-S cluster assembly ATPase SufC n=1 Tax=Castellaniella denitrificans TaxID=56119 RepID=A0ABT4M642_9BURK|nr:Fe-S cluster assembly ATPase SufC [Castellaniella denitrificans]MCZ4330798.1 Fe-S cluster assembly ATPase SufC [Castellaniella denitrificans]